MNARPTTQRLPLLLLSLLLILTTSIALAKDDERGYLGVTLQDMTSSMAKALQLDEDEGVLINKVVEDGPAAAAGLEDGDVILKFDGKAIDNYAALNKAVRATAPGDKVKVQYLHHGKRETTQIEMGESENGPSLYSFRSGGDAPHAEFFGEGGQHKVIIMSDGEDTGGHGSVWFDDGDDGEFEIHLEKLLGGGDRGFMGVELEDLGEQLGKHFGVDDGEGALISSVNDDSPAAKAGFKAGDVIVDVNGESIDDAGAVHAAMRDTEPEQEIEVKIVRKGKKKTIKVTLGEMPEGEFFPAMRGPHAPRAMKHIQRDFPHGMKHDIRVIAPGGPHKLRELHELHMLTEGSQDLAEMREQLDELQRQMKELKKELQQ